MAGFDDLTEDERAAVVTALLQTVDRDRYPLWPPIEAVQDRAGEAGSEIDVDLFKYTMVFWAFGTVQMVLC